MATEPVAHSQPTPRPAGTLGRPVRTGGGDDLPTAFALSLTDWSILGLACVGPVGLALGDRLHLALTAGGHTGLIETTGEVIWQQPCAQGHSYGLRLAALSPGAAAAWGALCAQGPGRPGDRPAPNAWAYVDAPAPTVGLRQLEFGAGRGLPSAQRQLQPEAGRQLGEFQPRGADRGPTLGATLWAGATGLLFGGAVVLAAYGVLVGRQGSRPASAPAAATSSTAPPPTAAPAPSAVVSSATGVTLLFTADGPIGAKELFWLQNPTRLVVDLMGRQLAAAAPVVAPDHPWVRRVRVGQHADRARFVVEVAPQVAPQVGAQVDGSAVAITLYAREDSP